MRLEGPRSDAWLEPGLPLLRLLQTFWGLAVIVALAGYSAYEAYRVEPPPVRILQARGLPPRAVVTGNAVVNPLLALEPSVTVHFACAEEDARIARIYDPPLNGRAMILRLDQSADQMRLVLAGTDGKFPADTRIVTTPCVQDMIDGGEFP